MSGVCALVDLEGGFPVRDRLRAMLAALEPFGPDVLRAHHVEADGRTIGIGHAQMRILPEDDQDTQPLVAAAGSLVLVADARIDNRADLAVELGIDVSLARAMPDSEIILEAYRCWQEDCPARLLGDFAFIVWDGARRRLFCARDPMGKRVLFYHASRQFFAIASSTRALLSVPEVPRRLNEEKIADFLVLLENGATTFYEGVQRLASAHTLTLTAGDVRLRRFWRPDTTRRVVLRSDDQYVEAFLEIFGKAVDARVRVRGEVGVMLSGGLDSPTVAAVTASRLRDEGRSLFAFHAAPPAGLDVATRPGWVLDETEDVAAVAALYPNIVLDVRRPDGRSLLDGLDRFFEAVGSPLRNPINRSWFEAIFETARDRGVRTMFSGQRGNATFSYTGLRGLREYARTGRWRTLLAEVRALAAAKNQPVRAILRDHVLLPLLPARALSIYRRARGLRPPSELAPRVQQAAAIHPGLAIEYDVDERIRAAGLDARAVRTASGRDVRVRMLSSLADGADILHCFRSWYGIEARDPTADIRVIEFCLAIPEAQYMRAGVDRYLVRRAMEGLLPPRLLMRTTRGTQAADWPLQMQAIRGAIAEELEHLAGCDLARRCLDLDTMRELVRRWPARLGLEHHRDYGLLLLRGIVMGRFIRWFESQHWDAPGESLRQTQLSA